MEEETIDLDNISCKRIKEGKTTIYQPNTVFYNPAQEFNRDLSVLVLDTFLENELWNRSKKAKKILGKEFNVLDALSASGLRGIRYANELENLNKIHKIYCNDLSPNAIKVIKHNVKFNELNDRIVVENFDANYLMCKIKYEEKPFLCVHLDPYGSAGLFLDSLVQSTYDGGLLMVTATDVAILCGNTPETCFAKYGSMSMKGNFCHEFALRILLRSIDQAAIKYGRYIVPLLSLSIDFYVRVFVQIFTGPNEAKKSANKTSMVYSCSGCGDFELLNFCTHNVNKKSNNIFSSIKFSLPTGPPVDRVCSNCNSNFRIAGPIWNQRLHDYDFVEMLKTNLNRSADELIGKQRFNTYRRLKGMVYLVGEELADTPLFYSVNELKPSFRIPPIPLADIRSAILNAGYQVSQSHTNADSVKTNAPSSLIWDIMVVWWKKINKVALDTKEEQENNVTESEEKKDQMIQAKSLTSTEIIINRKITHEISFKYNSNEMVESKRLGLLRYQRNPTKFWGPGYMPKANQNANQQNKKLDNQNKRKRKLDHLDEHES